MNKKLLKAGLIVAVGFLSSLSIAGSQNLVPNPGFELDKKSWSFWPRDGEKTKTVFAIDTDTYKTGAAAARIIASDLSDKGSLYTYIPVKERTKYKVSFWYKLKGIAPDSGSLKLGLCFNKQEGANGSAGKKDIQFPSGESDTDWKKFEGAFTTPAGTAIIQFALSVSGATGTVWFDDIEVSEEGTAAAEPK